MADERPSKIPPGFEELIPELPLWNNGAGIAPDDWITCSGTFPLAVGYGFVFWPSFVVFEDYVLRDGFTEESVRGFERQTGGNKIAVEAVINHIHLADLHSSSEQSNEAQLRYLGRLLKEVYEAKLAWQFPERKFQVAFNDEPGLDLLDYELTFWQER